MENHMDDSDRLSEDGQLHSKSELLQAQRLSRRIVWLAVLAGITIGICLTLFVETWYLLAGNIPNAFYPTSPVIYKLLSPLMIILMGFVAIMLGKLNQLRKQNPIFGAGRFDPLDINARWPSSLFYGLFLAWLGGFSVLVILFDPASLLGKSILFLWAIGGIAGLIVLPLVFRVKKRRVTRRS